MNQAASMVQGLRGTIADERVLDALGAIPRERFVPWTERRRAYENVALPIACDQTISQPLVVARMLELLSLAPDDRVLDVGTGSGYHAALLAVLAGHVWTIERHPKLSEQAEQTITELGIGNVSFAVGDGSNGLSEMAPFDAINVAAAVSDSVPTPLEDQLAPGGRLVAPVGTTNQHLILTRRIEEGLVRRKLEAVRFVPLVQEDRGDGA